MRLDLSGGRFLQSVASSIEGPLTFGASGGVIVLEGAGGVEAAIIGIEVLRSP